MKIRRSNPDTFKQLDLRIRELQKSQGKVGWFESSKYPNGTPVAYAAAINELGSPQNSIPARPFMRPSVQKNEGAAKELAASGARSIIAGKSTSYDMMEKLMAFMQGEILETIASIYSPALSPITIAARKYRQQGKKVTGGTIGEIAKSLKSGEINLSGISTKPLEDTGMMTSTLTTVVESK